jgi:molecular chaperone GrpE
MKNSDVNNRYREEELEEKENIAESDNEANEKEETVNNENTEEIVSELQKQINELKNEVLKCKANEINFKKHLEEDKMKSIKYANQGLLEKFVDQIDLFDSVVNMKTDDPVLKNFLIGFEIINNNFKQILSDEGVKKIVINKGDQFDPRYHEPFDTEWNSEYEENVILAELKGGYTYKDRVLRPTLVKINKKGE